MKSDRDEIWQDCSSSIYAPTDGVGFLLWRHNSRRRPWDHFTHKSAAIWWLHTQRVPGAYAAASVSSWSLVHSYLLLLLLVLVIAVVVTVAPKHKRTITLPNWNYIQQQTRYSIIHRQINNTRKCRVEHFNINEWPHFRSKAEVVLIAERSWATQTKGNFKQLILTICHLQVEKCSWWDPNDMLSWLWSIK